MLWLHHFLKKAWSNPGLFACAAAIAALLAEPAMGYDNPNAKNFQRAVAPMSTAKFLDYCAKNSDNHTRCEMEITLVDGRGSEHHDAPPFCGSHDYDKTANDVLAWLRRHRETANAPGDDGVYLALTSLYPCK